MKVKASKKRKRKSGRAANGMGTLVLRGNTYHARWYADGKLVSRSTGTGDLAEARQWLERQSVARTGQRDRAVVHKLATLMARNLADEETQLRLVQIPPRDLYKLYMDSAARPDIKPSTAASYEHHFRTLDEWLAQRHPEVLSIRDISQSIADEYAADRAKTASANTVNKDLNLFAATWRILARKYGLEYNPWTSDRIARKRHVPKGRRALTDDEVRRLLEASTGEVRLMILVGLCTGLRMGDILNLRWGREIDMDARTVRVERTAKTGAPVTLPIVPELYEALQKTRDGARDSGCEDGARDSGCWVFPGMRAKMRGLDTSSVVEATMAAFRKAGIETQSKETYASGRHATDASFHSLRHTFVSRLIRKGVSPAIVQAAVGHSSMLMTEHYTHIDAETMARAFGE